jgi:hypothetical protein
VIQRGVYVPLARGQNLVSSPKLTEVLLRLIAEHQTVEGELAEHVPLRAMALDPIVGGNRHEQVKLGSRDRILLGRENRNGKDLLVPREHRFTAKQTSDVEQLSVVTIDEQILCTPKPGHVDLRS